jgi:hypothetical protein
MYYLFNAGIDRHQQLRYEDWSFQIKDTTFRITHSKLDSSFYISYSTNPGSSSDFLEGRFIDNKNYTCLQLTQQSISLKAITYMVLEPSIVLN